ncbi:MAG: glutathione S-transferase C-terminal domain-containing protein [Betaproteobacteria bacterium]|jgi:glutathione S-transferase
MKLLGSVPSPFTRKVRIVLAEKRVECTFERVDVMAADSPVPTHNPLGKVPVLVLDDGATLYDSRVIAEFLDTVSPIGRLIPEESRNRIAVRRWESLADGVIDAGILIRYEQARDKGQQSAAWIERQMGKLERGLVEMAHELGDKPWCHGNGFTLADIAFGCTLGWLSFRFTGIDWRGQYPNLARHFDKLSERPAFADTLPTA